MSRTAGTTRAVTVDLGALPVLPASDSGYVFVRSADLPLEVIAAEPGVEIYPADLTMPEDASDTYTVVLTSQPTSNVTVTVTVPSGADVTVNGSPPDLHRPGLGYPADRDRELQRRHRQR